MSLCHGWSAGPTAWIMEHILGLKPLVPGFKFARFSPNLCDLNWARGKIPTPYGVIEVEVEKDKNGKYRFGYKAPSEIDMVVEEQKNTAKIVV
jgi:hypothetical protein